MGAHVEGGSGRGATIRAAAVTDLVLFVFKIQYMQCLAVAEYTILSVVNNCSSAHR